MKKEKEKKYFYPCACPPNFLPIFGRKHFCPFFFPILPKIHQTKHTLCVPIFIKSHTKKLNKRWASIPIKKRKKKKKKKKKKKMGIYQILLRCSFALVPSLLIFIKSHSNHLNKRWASIPILKKKKMKERKKERKIKKRRRWVFIKFFYLFALIPSLLIFIKSHTKQLNKRWAPIKLFYAARLLLSDLC